MILYAIYDKKAMSYKSPHFMPSEVDELRAFAKVCNDSDTDLFTYASDFVLVRLGELDDTTGKFIAEEMPVQVAEAYSMLGSKE